MHRPFLSHKREDAPLLAPLRVALLIRGAGAWQDIHDLTLGARWDDQLRQAILYDTQGFIWFATRASLGSATIRDIELPLALQRQRASPHAYPLIPAFVDLHPGADRKLIEDALGVELTEQLLALNGVSRTPGEAELTFATRIAAAYTRQLIRSHAEEGLRLRVAGRPVPADGRLVMDWTTLLDEGLPRSPEATAVMQQVVDEIRDAAHSVLERPRIEVEMDVRLPLAALIGSRWSRIRRVAPTFIQGSEREAINVDPALPGTPLPVDHRVQPRGGAGPILVAMSVRNQLGAAVDVYGEQVDAAAIHHLHVAAGAGERGALEPDEIAWVGHRVLQELRDVHALGVAKHLLLLGPVSLAASIGYGANGTGITTVPFWDRNRGYVGEISIE